MAASQPEFTKSGPSTTGEMSSAVVERECLCLASRPNRRNVRFPLSLKGPV